MKQSIKAIVHHVAVCEGKKHQASVGDIREIVGIISDILAHDPTAFSVLFENGLKRYKKRQALKKKK